jgi:hypothetical protein
MNDAIIIGYGTVGKATQKILKCDYVDKNDVDTERLYDFAIICVKREDLDNAITRAKRYSDNIIIRTTISPGIATMYLEYTLWPEFNVTESNGNGSNLWVMTENAAFRNYLLHNYYESHTICNVVTHREAALIKVWDNYRLLKEAELANKLEFICRDLDVCFDHVRNVIIQDTRHHDNYIDAIVESECFDLAKQIVEHEI